VDQAAASRIQRPTVVDLRGRFEGRLAALEPLAVEHERGLYQAALDGELFKWLPEDLGGDRGQLRHWLQTAIDFGHMELEVPFAILSMRTGLPVGSTRFHELRLEHLRVEIGWTWLARSVWGSGINIECKLLMLTHAFERVGCRRVEFKTDARNMRSRGALEALGARFEGVLRKHMVVQHGAARDSAYYSVIDDEWPAVKRHLQQRLERREGQ
jgi:N-acetyltransferase